MDFDQKRSSTHGIATVFYEMESTKKMDIFAVDTSLLKPREPEQVTIQTNLVQTHDWYPFNKLSINICKCEYLNFGPGESNN